jgi:hypothetical protein
MIMPMSLMKRIEKWRKHEKTTMSDAIRRLVEDGLAAGEQTKPTPRPRPSA